MAEIIKVYGQRVGALRFIGKKYGDKDRVNGNFSAKWGEWHSKGWFGIVEKQKDGQLKDIYEDGDAYIGLMRWKDGEPFEYWIGIFMPENTAVPEGFEYKDFPQSEFGVCWIYGKESEVYFNEEKCAAKLEENGFKLVPDEDSAIWFFERYACPRFTTPDDKGNIILDICYYIK
ncbi:MAG: hypothetical protein LBI03_02705 [Clostridiales bacterium]|jgi:predicted transcriptional regulator YdeE|nr:hypothetical protein [Clostridiales bacterium]